MPLAVRQTLCTSAFEPLVNYIYEDTQIELCNVVIDIRHACLEGFSVCTHDAKQVGCFLAAGGLHHFSLCVNMQCDMEYLLIGSGSILWHVSLYTIGSFFIHHGKSKAFERRTRYHWICTIPCSTGWQRTAQ